MAKLSWMSLAFTVVIFFTSCAKRRPLNSTQTHEKVASLSSNQFYLSNTVVTARPLDESARYYTVTLPNNDRVIASQEFLSKEANDDYSKQRNEYGSWPNATIYYEIDPNLENNSFIQKNFSCVTTSQGFRKELDKAIDFYSSMGFKFSEVTEEDATLDRIRILTLGQKRETTLATWKNIGGVQPLALTPNFCGREIKIALGYHLGVILPKESTPAAGLTGGASNLMLELQDLANQWRSGYADAKTLAITGAPVVSYPSIGNIPAAKITVNLPANAKFLSYVVLAKTALAEPTSETTTLYQSKYANTASTQYEGDFCNSINPTDFGKILYTGDVEGSNTFTVYINRQGNYDVLVSACVAQGFNTNRNPNKTNGDLACGNATKVSLSIRTPPSGKLEIINMMAVLQTASQTYMNTAGSFSNIRAIIQGFAQKGEACNQKVAYWNLIKTELASQSVRQVGPLILSNLYFTAPESYSDHSEEGAQLTGISIFRSSNGEATGQLGRKSRGAKAWTFLTSRRVLYGTIFTSIGAVIGSVLDIYAILKPPSEQNSNSNLNAGTTGTGSTGTGSTGTGSTGTGSTGTGSTGTGSTGTGSGSGAQTTTCSPSKVAVDQSLLQNTICINQYRADTVKKEITRLLNGGSLNNNFDVDRGSTCR